MKPGKSFGTYYRMTITKPRQAFADLASERRMLPYSFYAVTITALLYTFVYLFLIYGGGKPFKPWLDIPPENYYRYNIFFCAPSMFLGWILAAGVTHLVSRLWTKQGTFEQILAVFAFGISIASWTTGFHDILTSFLGAIHIISQNEYEAALNSPSIWRTILWIQMTAYLVCFIYFFSISVNVVYQASIKKSVFMGVLGFMTYQLFFLIFNR